MAEKRSWSDRNASRRGVPGETRQVPTEHYRITSPDGRTLGKTEMNFGGVMGGNPSTDLREMESRLKAYENAGHVDSANALRRRIENIRRHKELTYQAMKSLGQKNVFQQLAHYLGF